MPTNKQEREKARRNLQQQLERRREAEARRRKTMIGVTVVATLAVIGVVLGLVIGLGGSDDKPSAAGPDSPAPTASTGTDASTGPCGYTPSPADGNANIVNVGLPPDPSPTPTTTRTLAFTTNQGAITIQLDGAQAPCNVQSVGWLAQTGFYDGTSCHRLVTEGIFVLQCGDPSGTGSGGPAYKVKDENLTSADYAEGVVAMANSGANTNSSQFFIMTKDSNAGLAKSYTVIGKVTVGLDIIEKVAAAGTTDGNTDGKPKDTLTFTKATVTPAIPTAAASSPAAVSSGASGSPAN